MQGRAPYDRKMQIAALFSTDPDDGPARLQAERAVSRLLGYAVLTVGLVAAASLAAWVIAG